MEVYFEKTQLKDFQAKLGGRLRTAHDETWLCYHAPNENKTYWFISTTLMEKGNLSTVIISELDKSSGCDSPQQSIALKVSSIPYVGDSQRDVEHFFNITSGSVLAVLNTKTHHEKGQEYDQLNIVQYFFKGEKVNGVMISQISST